MAAQNPDATPQSVQETIEMLQKLMASRAGPGRLMKAKPK
jgi:hypothetical protein